MINDSITNEETCMATDCLKNGKSPGTDDIPTEFVKSCKSILSSEPIELYHWSPRLPHIGGRRFAF